jgi:hypothetical protein
VKKKSRNSSQAPGMTHANITIPEALHLQMKAIRLTRYRREGTDVKLSRIYIEAIQQYVNSHQEEAEEGQPDSKPVGKAVSRTLKVAG